MLKIKITVLLLAVLFILTGCNSVPQEPAQPENNGSELVVIPLEETTEEISEENSAETLTELLTEKPTETVSQPAEETTEKHADKQAEYKQKYWFRNKNTLNSHFEKHGGEFGGQYKTAAEYETGADKVAQDPSALHKTEKEDGDDVYYIESTNEFVVVSKDGYIRTYFKPSAGKKYFDRQ